MQLPKARLENIVVQEADKELLIYDLKTNKAYCLNETSAMVYQLCDGKNSIPDIAVLLRRRLNNLFDEDLVWLALDQLKRDSLLEVSDEFEIDFGGLSRRQMVCKVGLASMVVLPVILSITAPKAISAQSICDSGTSPCTFNDFTQSNCCDGFRCNDTEQCVACRPAGFNFANCIAPFSTCVGFCNTVLAIRNTCCDNTSPVNVVAVSPISSECRCP